MLHNIYVKQNLVQHYLNWSWYCTLCASYFWIFVLSLRCCLFPRNFMTTVLFSSTGWSQSAVSPMNSLCVKQNSLSEITDQLHLLLRLRAIVSVVVLWSNNGSWTEIWIQPSACFETTSKRSLVLSWNQCSVWAYVGFKQSMTSFQGILETPLISPISFILPLKRRMLVHHLYWIPA